MSEGLRLPSSLFEKTAWWFERSQASLLGNLPCRRGCSGCCVGVFPVTILDRQEIQRGLRALPEDHRKRIERTAAEQVTALSIAAPRLNRSRFIDQWPEEDIDRITERFATWFCPALEQDETCSLYEFRPLVCRSMGLPQDDGGLVSGACAVQTAVPLVRLSTAMRVEENQLAAMEAEELSAVRHHDGAQGEELLLPFAFCSDFRAERTADTT